MGALALGDVFFSGLAVMKGVGAAAMSLEQALRPRFLGRPRPLDDGQTAKSAPAPQPDPGPATAPSDLEPTIYRFIRKHSMRGQLLLLLLTAASLPFLYFSLDLPKTIIN